MKWILYAVSVLAMAVAFSEADELSLVTEVVLLLIGTTSFGLAVVAGKLDAVVKRLDGRAARGKVVNIKEDT